MQDFRKLRVWQYAKDYTVAVYQVTADFPAQERFGLMPRLRRSAISICANLAEGCGYTGNRDSARFFEIALGSATESLSHQIIARELGYLSDGAYDNLESASTGAKAAGEARPAISK